MVSKIGLFSKKWLDTLFIPLVIVLVGLGAFGLGRLSAVSEGREGLKIYGPGAVPVSVSGGQGAAVISAVGENSVLVTGAYVASKNGSKYYLTTCAGANRINEENKIWFPSAAAAAGAGYEPAANCPGLTP